MSDWSCLRKGKIIDLLIGDLALKNGTTFDYLKMPYMKGYQICEFGKQLGFEFQNNEEKLSRRQIMDKVIDYAIINDRINDFFKIIISKERFEYLADINSYFGEPETLYWDIINNLFERINQYLAFENKRIDYDFKKYIFKIKGFEEEYDTDKDFNEIIKDFCKNIKKEGLLTKYGNITKIVDPGKQGGNGKILFGILNDKNVAIKVLITDNENKRLRFFEEFLNVLMSLEKAEGIVELYLYDTIKIEGKEIQYIVMKKYENNLSEINIQDQNELLKFSLELARIIDKVHEKGIIHRDIKPENIMQDAEKRLILTDFGIAYFNPDEFENTGHTVSNDILGNRVFFAPEQLKKGAEPKPTMDIYSYGQMLQYIVTGKPHYGTDKVKIGRFINGDKIDSIDNIIIKCLQSEPDKRYQTMKDIIEDLVSLIDTGDDLGNKHNSKKVSSIDSNNIYEYICINDIVSTKELAEEFNYDIFKLKQELINLYKVKRLIKPASLLDLPENNDCNWIRCY